MDSLDTAMALLAKRKRVRKLKAAARRRTDAAPALAKETILDFMVRVSPHLQRADHFRVYAERLERAVGGDLRLVFAAPPQHGKTQVTLHGLAKIVQRHPDKRHAYITYNQQRSRNVARSFQRILKSAGIAFSGNLDQLVLPGGGQVIFTSIDGGITGEAVDGVAIIDDPLKGRKEADSATRREVVEMAYREAIATRCHPGASILVLATRWHPHDLSGVLVGEGWEYINLPAIAEGKDDPNGRKPGEALCAFRPLAWLLEQKRRILDFSWAALYQGRPRPKGGKVFHEPNYYSQLPTKSYRGAYGVDLAYTAKSSADTSVCCEVWREERPEGIDPVYYVIHVDRAQVEAPVFKETLVERRQKRPSWRMLWRASGTEKGAADFIRPGTDLQVEPPPGDKLVSATDAAALWNAGRLLVPDPDFFPEVNVWLPAFLDILANFTGLGKEHDDDVDALGNAIAALDALDDVTTHRIKSSRGR